MVTAAWILGGFVVLVLLQRILWLIALQDRPKHDKPGGLWPMRKVIVYKGDSWKDDRIPVTIDEHWGDREPTVTGVTPSGPSYVKYPKAGGALIPKGWNKLRWRK